MEMSSALPSSKVTASGLAGLATTVVLFLINSYWLTERPLPGEVCALITTLVSGVVAWLTPPSDRDVAVTKD